MISHRWTILLFVSVFGSMLVQPSHAKEKLPVFERDVQPILAKKCGKCHSAKVRKGMLDLSSMTGLRRGGESGEAAIANSVEDSLLWIMIDGGDMPPEGQTRLTGEEIAIIRRWIATGAKSESRWSGQKRKSISTTYFPSCFCVARLATVREFAKVVLISALLLPCEKAGKVDRRLLLAIQMPV